jgi:hypothetical protein
LPYDGFYPVQRTLQLSTLFKDSLEPNTTVRGSDASFQTVNNTIFSRLTYGSIRAGVATDTAIWQSGTLFESGTLTGQVLASSSFDVLDYLALTGPTTDITTKFVFINDSGLWNTNWRGTPPESASAIMFAIQDVGYQPYYSTTLPAGSGALGGSLQDEPFLIYMDNQPDGLGTSPTTNAEAAERIREWVNYYCDPANNYFTSAPLTASDVGDTVIFKHNPISPEQPNPDGNAIKLYLGEDTFGIAVTGTYLNQFSGPDIDLGHDPNLGGVLTYHSASFGNGVNGVFANKRFNPTASWSRLPFETIISPSSYLNSNVAIEENDPENYFNSTAFVNFVGGTYELAASNFYAGVIDTFIENKTLTTIKTSPQSQWSFSDATLNNYVMDVVVSKPDGFSNHDDPAANGAPYTAHACFYQPLNYSGAEWWTKHITNGSSSVNAEIPPAASWSENKAIVTINFDYNAFKTAVTERDKPNFGDILQYSTRTFKNKQMFDQLGATDAI